MQKVSALRRQIKPISLAECLGCPKQLAYANNIIHVFRTIFLGFAQINEISNCCYD